MLASANTKDKIIYNIGIYQLITIFFSLCTDFAAISLQVRALIKMAYGFDVEVPPPEPVPERHPVCGECRARLSIRHVVVHPFGPPPDDG